MGLLVLIQHVTAFPQAEAAPNYGSLAEALSPAVTNLVADGVTGSGKSLAQALLLPDHGFFRQSAWSGAGAQ